jgi:uncharacterized protein DUF5818
MPGRVTCSQRGTNKLLGEALFLEGAFQKKNSIEKGARPMIRKKKMSSILALVFGMILVLSSIVWTQSGPLPSLHMQQMNGGHENQQTWTGTIKKDDSGKLVLVTGDGKMFRLTPEDQVSSLVDKSVKVTGSLKGDVITVTSVEPTD